MDGDELIAMISRAYEVETGRKAPDTPVLLSSQLHEERVKRYREHADAVVSRDIAVINRLLEPYHGR